MGLLLLAWLAAGILLIWIAGIAPVSRTQEGRVLVAAQEMAQAPAEGWLIPRVNGEVRLRKPPLAYWLSAASIKLFGESERAGRLPMVIGAWLSLALVYHAGSWLFGSRAGLLSAIALYGCFGFARYGRLAETDVLLILFLAAASYGMWRGFVEQARWPRFAWFQFAAVAIAAAVMTKGPPAAYPLLFFIALVAMERKWKALVSWLGSCSWLTVAVLAVPWFLVILYHPAIRQVVDELNEGTGGLDHGHSPLTYVPALLVITLPWSGFVILGLIAAVHHFREDYRLRGLLLWIASILVPLLFWKNRQQHYLLPLLPPLMLLTGWILSGAVGSSPDARTAKASRSIWLIMLGLAMLVGPAIVIAARRVGGAVLLEDLLLGCAVLTAAVGSIWIWRRNGMVPGLLTFALTCALTTLLLVGWWLPSLAPAYSRQTALQIEREFGAGPYAFYGTRDSLAISYYLEGTNPTLKSESAVRGFLAQHPHGAIIEVLRPKEAGLPLPRELTRHRTFEYQERVFAVHQAGN